MVVELVEVELVEAEVEVEVEVTGSRKSLKRWFPVFDFDWRTLTLSGKGGRARAVAGSSRNRRKHSTPSFVYHATKPLRYDCSSMDRVTTRTLSWSRLDGGHTRAVLAEARGRGTDDSVPMIAVGTDGLGFFSRLCWPSLVRLSLS